jgi:hypothetical protein
MTDRAEDYRIVGLREMEKRHRSTDKQMFICLSVSPVIPHFGADYLRHEFTFLVLLMKSTTSLRIPAMRRFRNNPSSRPASTIATSGSVVFGFGACGLGLGALGCSAFGCSAFAARIRPVTCTLT